MRFHPHDEWLGDHANLWAADEACVLGLLQAAGFIAARCIDKCPGFRGGGRIPVSARK